MSHESLFFDYDLPRELIAQYPLENRADARLMVLNRSTQEILHWHVRDLPELLRPYDCLVLNNTKVLPAQLHGTRRTTGGRWQGLFLGSDTEGHWRIVCKTRGRLAPGDSIVLDDREGKPSLTLWLLERLDGGEWLAHPESEEPVHQILEKVGRIPLPHYIRGGRMVDSDQRNYQTVFASRPGAVAAPTAGLHFTRDLLTTIGQRGVEFAPVTLHVGLGTFRPVTAETPEEHRMHEEWGELPSSSVDLLQQSRSHGGRVVAVGTTSVRVLESAARAASNGVSSNSASSNSVSSNSVSSNGAFAPWSGETDLFIYPPYEFRAVDALMTNFHFPRTTLLLMVQAFGGTELVRQAYEEAVREEYRFYSYGDAMLIV